jgi:hypothetical protein
MSPLASFTVHRVLRLKESYLRFYNCGVRETEEIIWPTRREIGKTRVVLDELPDRAFDIEFWRTDTEQLTEGAAAILPVDGHKDESLENTSRGNFGPMITAVSRAGQSVAENGRADRAAPARLVPLA